MILLDMFLLSLVHWSGHYNLALFTAYKLPLVQGLNSSTAVDNIAEWKPSQKFSFRLGTLFQPMHIDHFKAIQKKSAVRFNNSRLVGTSNFPSVQGYLRLYIQNAFL